VRQASEPATFHLQKKETAMKKQLRKIVLSRETLHGLDGRLEQVAAGAATFPPVCENSGNAINGCSVRC
jgi:hypothetical protein